MEGELLFSPALLCLQALYPGVYTRGSRSTCEIPEGLKRSRERTEEGKRTLIGAAASDFSDGGDPSPIWAQECRDEGKGVHYDISPVMIILFHFASLWFLVVVVGPTEVKGCRRYSGQEPTEVRNSLSRRNPPPPASQGVTPRKRLVVPPAHLFPEGGTPGQIFGPPWQSGRQGLGLGSGSEQGFPPICKPIYLGKDP